MNRVIGYLAIASVVMIFVLGTLLKSARADLNAAELKVQAFEEAARIHARYVVASEALKVQSDDDANFVKGLEGRDAPLNDHLRSAAERLWP